MTAKELLSHVDHTLLSPGAVWEDVRALCDEAMTFGTASVCIPPTFVKRAKAYCGDRMRICTVIGFPAGYHLPAVKALETRLACEDGADEIDMVIHIGLLKEGKTDEVRKEIEQVRKACEGKILKVIVETCLLTEREKIDMCRVVREAGADYIKTSTGFSHGGATREDVALFAEHCQSPLRIKAAGGIRTLEDAAAYLALGADRLGTSRVVKLLKDAQEKKGDESELSNSSY